MKKVITFYNDKIIEETAVEFESKKDMEVIDATKYIAIQYPINKFLKRNLRETTVRPDYFEAQDIIKCHKLNDTIFSIYDHMHWTRLTNPLRSPRKSINVTFTFPYNKLSKITEEIQKPWVDQDYKIYLTNPRLFRYYQKNTIGLAHIKDEDKKHGEGTTEKILSHINSMMVKETGESLFYKIV